MKLMTEEIISQFEAHPIGSQDGKRLHAEVLVKYFNPCGSGTWLITEAEREGDVVDRGAAGQRQGCKRMARAMR